MDIGRARVMRAADLQWGRVSWRQLCDLGASERRISHWARDGYLRPVLPHVYAVGHVAESVEAELMGAVLYAGPGAMLSHATALWWYDLLEHRPTPVEVSTPRKCRSQPAVKVHSRRRLELARHRRLPITTVAQALLDFASRAPERSIVQALAEADYRRLLDASELRALRGPGSAALKRASRLHAPALARTQSVLERRFHALCRRGGIPAYEVNHPVCGIHVDACWPELGVVVELDGVQGHATPAQVARDRRRDLRLRAAGFVVVRYSYDQVTYEPELVLDDLRAVLAGAAARAARSG